MYVNCSSSLLSYVDVFVCDVVVLIVISCFCFVLFLCFLSCCLSLLS